MKRIIALLFCFLPLFLLAQGYGENYTKQQLDSLKLAKIAERTLQKSPGIYKSDILLEKAGSAGQAATVFYAISIAANIAAIAMQSDYDKRGEVFDYKPYAIASGVALVVGIGFNLKAWNLIRKAGFESRKEKEQLLLKIKGNGLALVYKF